MAVMTQPVDSRLTLTLYMGDDDDGEPMEMSKSFNNVKTEADDEDLYAIAQGLSTLQTYELIQTERTDRNALVEEEEE